MKGTIKKGSEIKATNSQCIGAVPTIWTYFGTIVKVNKKSILVNFERMTREFGKNLEADTEYHGTEKFTFWKTLDDGTELYRSQLNGIIRF